MRANIRNGAGILLAVAVTASAAQAQGLRPVVRAPRVQVGLAVVLGQPTGEFANYVGLGYGAVAHLLWAPSGIVGLRADAIWLTYGNETRRYQLLPLVDVDVTTVNQIWTFHIGPQLTIGTGDAQLYGYGQLGFSDFVTTSSAAESGDIESFANSTNFDDFTFATSAGGGVRFQLTHGRVPVALDLGARYLYNGRARYLREGSIQITGNTVSYTPIESQTNLILYQLGVTVGLGR